MTRKDLAKLIAKKTNLNSRQAENLVIAFGAVVTDAMAKEEKIVYSNFGTFYTVHYPSKVIQHPRLGAQKKMVMLPTNAVKWMPSGNIKELVKNSIVADNPTMHGSKKSIIGKLPLVTPTNLSKMPIVEKANEKIINEDESVDIPINKPSIAKSQSNDLNKSNEAKSSNPVNIYEELMHDGSKEMSTFGDAIRVHKKNFWGRMFNREQNPPQKDVTAESNSKVSLVNSGIFNKESSAISQVPNPQEKKINNIKNEFSDYSKALPEQNNVAQIESDKKIQNDLSPFTDKTNISFIDLSKYNISKDLLQKIPEKIARNYKAVPVEEDDRSITIAMADPQDLEAREIIKKQVQKLVIPRLASEADINVILDQYGGLENEVKEAVETADKENDLLESKVKTANLSESASDSAPAARIVTSVLRRAIRDKASDIHIEPTEKELEVRFRLDGVLEKKITLPSDIKPAVISRIKILSNMKIDEQRLPQDGRFSINFENRRIDFRVSTLPVANGEKVVMRVLDKMTGILTVEELGIQGSGLETLKNNIEKSHGMTLVTGPTGSGKTTTLYALIDKLYTEGVNIVTLEDPIEYQMPGINQSQVNHEIDYTFASGLRSIVRQDPDIIMIGEIRDKETAEMSVHAALTGHIVLSTLHTNDATGAAPRLIDMGVEPFLLTSALNMVIGQRLGRKICEECKEEIKISDVELQKINEIIAKMPETEKSKIAGKELKFYHGKGCKKCNDSGYKGRIGMYEVFEINEQIKELILNKKPSSVIEEEAIKNGMVTMLQDGILKALDGITTIEEVFRVTKD